MLKPSFLKGAAAGALALASVLVLFFNSGRDEKQELEMSLQQYVVASFLAELPAINSKLPHAIDASTTLQSIRYTDGKVVSLYQLTGTVQSTAALDPTAQKALIRRICTDELKGRLMDAGLEFTERYQDAGSRLVSELTVNSSACAKATAEP